MTRTRLAKQALSHTLRGWTIVGDTAIRRGVSVKLIPHHNSDQWGCTVSIRNNDNTYYAPLEYDPCDVILCAIGETRQELEIVLEVLK